VTCTLFSFLAILIPSFLLPRVTAPGLVAAAGLEPATTRL
jgi:hypothetical protein